MFQVIRQAANLKSVSRVCRLVAWAIAVSSPFSNADSSIANIHSVTSSDQKLLEVTAYTAHLSEALQLLAFTGIVEIKTLYDLTAKTRGIIRGLTYDKTVFKGDTPVLTIVPADPNFALTTIYPPFENARLVRRYVDNGHFVHEDDLLVQIAQGQNYTVAFQVPGYEVQAIRDADDISMTLYSPNGKSPSLPIGKTRIEHPIAGDTLYRVEIDVDCSQAFACEEAQLSGALVSVDVYPSTLGQLQIPRKALINGEARVMVLSDLNVVVIRDVALDRTATESSVTVLHGVNPGEHVIVDYNRLPIPNEIATQVYFSALESPKVSYEP